MIENLAALQVVIPLIAAPLCVLARGARIAWVITVIASWLSLAVSIALLIQVVENGPISYAMGGWLPPFGIEYRIDELNAILLLLVSGAASITMPYAYRSVGAEIPDNRIYLFYATLLLCITGLLGIAITGDAFNVFVFLEISSLSSYALIAMGRSRRALIAAFQYLIMGTIGATFLLIGIGFLYMLTGTLNMADLADRIAGLGESRVLLAALAFIIVGLSLKLALFPLHQWLPDAYARAPSVVSSFLAGTATKVAAYALIRFLFTVFGVGLVFRQLPVGETLLAIGAIAALTGSIVAVFQQDVRRLLAYSTVAQIGYIVMGISFATETGLTGAILHIVNHAVVKAALFLALGNMVLRLGSTQLSDLAGVARRMPWTSAAFVIGGLGIIGVPLTPGFVSKLYLVSAAIEIGAWHWAVVILVSSLLAVAYVWRVVEIAYLHQPVDETRCEAPRSMLFPLWALIGITFWLGISSVDVATLANAAALRLLGG